VPGADAGEPLQAASKAAPARAAMTAARRNPPWRRLRELSFFI
jgi:hypothetical protein